MVYSKTGSYVGSETNIASWTLLQTLTVVRMGEGTFTPLLPLVNPLRVNAGSIQSFYITLTSSNMRYTNGNSTGALIYQDSNLEFFQGAGKKHPIDAASSTFDQRIWNGRIKYNEVV